MVILKNGFSDVLQKNRWTKKQGIRVQKRNETKKLYCTGIYQIPSDILMVKKGTDNKCSQEK